MVYKLYRGEFFAYSLATSVSGCVFFFFSKGVAFNTRGILLGLLALAALVFVAVFAAAGREGKGRFEARRQAGSRAAEVVQPNRALCGLCAVAGVPLAVLRAGRVVRVLLHVCSDCV